ncbi:hypothetical protein HHO41_15185 [Bacillus sp. DNRA2]|uniref:hypothetical protein n=1 Tax=Bacillus sp. DNRA2 TaxID=2723053 RepID=UPI00145E0AFC|nr:hypothetical protein [Bacillus sp. DNRA2]NMD71642.1 hypothetical protein [Bacillus sp. DNRA2]
MTEIISTPLTRNEKYVLDEYLGTRELRDGLYPLIQDLGETVPRLYRGTMYLLEDVKIGHIYRHWNRISSWSTDEMVATQFALEQYVPEDYLHEMVRKWKFPLRNLQNLFVPIVLICENVKGYVVNHHYKEHLYVTENEVIVYDAKLEISSIMEVSFENITYFRVFCHSLI